jgi:predicted ATP-grasp superfamily ATP-dependent carboligase
MKSKAVVLGHGINGLGVIRNLGRASIEVTCVTNYNDFCLSSKYVTEKIIYSNIEENPESLLSILKELSSRNPTISLCLFPCSDAYLLSLARIREHLPSNILLNQPCSNTLQVFVDKLKFEVILNELNIPHPKTYRPQSEQDLEKIKEQLTYPIFVKPLVSHLFRRHFPGKKGFTAENFDKLRHYYQLAESKDISVMVQEIVPGKANNHFFIDGYVSKEGGLKTIFARKRLHMFPLDWGNSTSMVSVSPDSIKPAIDNLKNLLTRVNYRGIFSLEVKHDHRDQCYKFIELNARSWWYNIFPTMCNDNIIKMAYDDMLGLPIEENSSYKLNKYFVYWWPEIKSWKALHKSRGFSYKSIVKEIKFTPNSPIFAAEDPSPLFRRFWETVQNKLGE